MKRAIFRKHSIDVCVEHGILCTPITPETLPFCDRRGALDHHLTVRLVVTARAAAV
jgi:hypothetical protein